jgi:hypothetical protein
MAEHPVPVLGINFGTVGFLVETHPTEIADALTIRPARAIGHRQDQAWPTRTVQEAIPHDRHY